ncbi:TNF receptor-associated factor 5 [Dicentrarchus labrax]|uniref:TNF receptor-associated factor n=1 Tax=Dicentrarchus labrax TaxID=13489 RepID=A0A8C4I279_DICLA|nr:TNF receptor-associated factor 5 [Dicentrarchus labrax]XP_051238122.1 TNF receptor-associated factor 5 [Dicentrarchus labrax]XP_051238123.1 TNF receptor-associated factor 5 [Dicentrarchus labrax]
MATTDTKLGGSKESSLQSEESVMSEESRMRSTGPVWSWESELTSIQHSLKFVLTLKDEFVCPVCRGVVLNPQQNSCGHIYCFHCLQGLLETSSSPACPVDGAVITPAEVFQDNCCKREISNLEVYCTNYPECTSVVTLHNLQEHLRSCPYEQLQCCNSGCRAALQRRYLQEHQTDTCPHRTEPCPHCQQLHRLSLIQDHVQSSCPEVEVDCPNGCSQKVPRHKLSEHSETCPEVPIDCSYKRFGCCVQGKRVKVKLHEDAAVNLHMLLVLRSNTHLEQQVEVLQEEALQRKQEVQTDSLLLAGLQKEIRPLLQQNGSHELIVSTAQRTLSRQQDALSTVQLEVQQVSRALGPGLEELEQLRKSLDAVIQEVSATEALKEHLGTLEENLKHHSGLLDLHAAQLNRNKQHLQELEATSYDGRLIWKIDDFRNRREAEVRGQPPCLSSVPFHTGRCGYKMAAKVYLNGDGEGRGTHLSLYVVLMPGDFDALLPWPFRQTVSLSVLDQSGAGNHRSLSFRPDQTSKSFQRPGAESVSNVAVGFSCFIPLNKLETPQNAVYISDDTLFVKVKVDMTGLEQL